MLESNARHTSHCFSISARSAIVVRIRRVLLKAERRRHEVDGHAERFAQRQHHRRRLGRGQARQFVDGELAQITSSGLGRERLLARGAVFVVAPFHLLERRPHIREQLRKLGFIEREADRRNTRAHAVDQVGRHVRLHPGGRVRRRLRLRELRRQIERDVAGEHAAAHERVLARVELAADRLMVGVEAPGDAAAGETRS